MENRNIKLYSAQIEGATKGVRDLLAECPKEECISTLTLLLQMKEKAVNALCEQLEDNVVSLQYQGMSTATVAVVAEGYVNAIRTASSQMCLFAAELAKITHTSNIAQAYESISERVEHHVTDLLRPYMEAQEAIINDADEASHAECWAAYHYSKQS